MTGTLPHPGLEAALRSARSEAVEERGRADDAEAALLAAQSEAGQVRAGGLRCGVCSASSVAYTSTSLGTRRHLVLFAALPEFLLPGNTSRRGVNGTL